jgi:hypothetical protein
VTFDPRQRLNRSYPGQRFQKEEPWVEMIFKRGEEKPDRELLPRRDLKQGRTEPKMKVTSRLASPKPNAPLLIRLVRFRYALQTVRPVKKKYFERPPPIEKVDWQKEVATALAERTRTRSNSPAGRRPRLFVIRPSQWALVPKIGEEQNNP